MKVYSPTHCGLVRKHRGDRFTGIDLGNSSMIAAVADGMGAHSAGERAVEIAVRTMSNFRPDTVDPEGRLGEPVKTAYSLVREASAKNFKMDSGSLDLDLDDILLPERDGLHGTITCGFPEVSLAVHVFRAESLTARFGMHVFPALHRMQF